MSSLTLSSIKARNQLIMMYVALLALDALLIALTRDLWAIGRILFIAGVMFLTLQGYKWAKWLLVGILSLVVVALVALIAVLGEQLSWIVSVGSVVMAVLSCIIMAYLVGNNDLNQYFASKRHNKT